MSHVTGDDLSDEAAEQARAAYQEANAPGVTRTRKQVTRFFDGLDLIPPGVVSAAEWKAALPLRRSARTIFYAGAARKNQDPETVRQAGDDGWHP